MLAVVLYSVALIHKERADSAGERGDTRAVFRDFDKSGEGTVLVDDLN